MFRLRRQFLKNAAATATLASLPAQAQVPDAPGKPGHVGRHGITELFRDLPGDLGMRILAPPRKGRHGISVQINADRMLFAASGIKTFALGESLRQLDSPHIVEALEAKELVLDESVWSLGSPIFNPPDLTGLVTQRTALEAMITRSDNTATDMIFKAAGVDNIRHFIASAGLTKTRVPDSTRAFAAYLFGAENYKTITWDQLLLVAGQGQVANPFLNDVQTLASSADDFVRYYAHALTGELFEHPETLQEFRRILTLCDFIYIVPVPLGVSAYMKSGNADTPGFHVRTIAGGLYVADQWVFYAFIHNWYSPDATDKPTVDHLFEAINASLTRVIDAMT